MTFTYTCTLKHIIICVSTFQRLSLRGNKLTDIPDGLLDGMFDQMRMLAIGYNSLSTLRWEVFSTDPFPEQKTYQLELSMEHQREIRHGQSIERHWECDKKICWILQV